MITPPRDMPSFFSEAQHDLVICILNRLVPASGAFPGAGDLGVGGYVDGIVGRSAELRRLFTQGLAHIAVISQQRFGHEFAGLSDTDQDVVLRQVESSDTEFFKALVTHTYSGYYSHPTVVQFLGIPMRPPQPHGYDLESWDLSLLERVRQRGQRYRPTS